MVHFFMLLLEALFLVGLAGSLVVAILALVGDIHEFFEKDRSESPREAIGD